MARQLCIEFENAFYHVFSRGHNKQIIFYSNIDFLYFESLLEEFVLKFNIKIYAYCLMSNHYHLFLSTPLANLSTAMKWLNQMYANHFLRMNKDKVGNVFSGRYKRILVQEENYATVLIRYIHFNPVKANLCKAPADWTWSSYKLYLSNNPKKNFIDYDWVKQKFGLKHFTKNFIKYHQQPDIQEINLSSQCLGDIDFHRKYFGDLKRSFNYSSRNNLARKSVNVKMRYGEEVRHLSEDLLLDAKTIAQQLNKTTNAIYKQLRKLKKQKLMKK
ncbi:MAG: transposase [Candidatus Caenarcaniphilales bacterium]|jgi:REP element-mobilizing transposase RayT|nr:transposase [Candidatus Caenarcaniphilales bacterium]